jgi:raffinose/stachyose/melibiose transport system permease protein
MKSLSSWRKTWEAHAGRGFADIFLRERKFGLYLGNTFLFAVVTTTLKIALGLCLALLLNRRAKAQSVFRAVFYLPVVLSPLIIGIVFHSIFDPTTGLLNQFLGAVGLSELRRQWLADPSTAMLSVMGVEVWRLSGYCMVIFLAGLQLIPRSFYEAADIDGAGAWRKFYAVTLPFLQHAFTINVIMNLIWGLKVFDIVFVLTKGDPGYLTGVLQTAVFFEFSAGIFGLATAIGVVVFLLCAIVAFLVLRIFTRREVDLV